MEGRVPNVGSDPINPAYYAGTACAEIIEHMPTNVGFAAKYAWRLGEKDSEAQEAGKAIWYLEREIKRCKAYPISAPGYWYHVYCIDRVAPAYDAGKLDENRMDIVMQCVQYTLTGNKQYLESVIDLFKTYL